MTPVLEPAQVVRNLQIIVVAMALGCLGFLFAIFVVLERQKNDSLVMTLVGVSSAIGMAAVRLTVPGTLVAGARRSAARANDEAVARTVLLQSYFMTSIIALALHEGAVFLNLILYAQTGAVANLAVAAVMFLGIPLLFPTLAGVEDWIESQKRLGPEG